MTAVMPRGGDPLADPVVCLRPGLLEALQQSSAGELAARIGWADVAGLQRALDGEPCGVNLLSALALAFIPTPVAWFATPA